jgi:Methyltransferase domain
MISARCPHHNVLATLGTASRTYLEVGVQDGDSVVAVVGDNPHLDLTMCDTWGPHHGGTDRKTHEHVEERLVEAGHQGSRLYLDGDSHLLIPKLVQGFDLVHIDADHSYEGCKADLRNCWPLTEKWLVVHDIFFGEVRDAVFQFLEWNMPDIANIAISAYDHGTIVIERRER